MDNTREFYIYLYDDESTRKKEQFLLHSDIMDDDERNELELQSLRDFLDNIPLGSRVRFGVTFEPLPIPSEVN